MKAYMFYTTEGFTESPTNDEVENCQVLGIAFGTDGQQALQNLLAENPWIEETGFDADKIVYQQLLTDIIRRDISELLDYLWDDEEQDYEKTGKPDFHIFNVLKELKAMC